MASLVKLAPCSVDKRIFYTIEEKISFVVEFGNSVFDVLDEEFYPLLHDDEVVYEIDDGYYVASIFPISIDKEDRESYLYALFGNCCFEKLLPKILEYQELVEAKKLVFLREYKLHQKI